jgi:hypothetical protein
MKISGTPRARTREDVRQIFARTPEAPQRTCPHCGAQTQTREEHCPACGRSYFERPDRFSPRTRRVLQGAGALAAAAVLALVVVVLVHLATDNGTSARGRVARHELRARSIRSTSGHALVNNARGDELDLRKPLGRYACEAAVETASNGGITSTLGVPFVGTINFPKGRLTWCKDNPTSASDIKSALAFVRLARECTAARGPVFGSGYLIEPCR